MQTLDKREHTKRDRATYDESYIGKRFNHLTVIGIERDFRNQAQFKCRCDCGRVKLIQPHAIVTGKVKACGCKQRTANGHSKERLYVIWGDMNERCNNPKSQSYRYYGARGIKVCREWRNSYETFREWAFANGYDKDAKRGDCTLDRINVNGNYEPENCRWVDMGVQLQNRRPSSEWRKRDREGRLIEINGEKKELEEWCREYGITSQAVYYRMRKTGMTVQEAITKAKKPGIKII